MPPGQGFIYSAGASQITPRARMPLESPEGSCVHGWEHWHSKQSHGDDFWEKIRTLSFAKGQTAWEGTIFVFKDLMSWLERRGTMCVKSLKILVMHDPTFGAQENEWFRQPHGSRQPLGARANLSHVWWGASPFCTFFLPAVQSLLPQYFCFCTYKERRSTCIMSSNWWWA